MEEASQEDPCQSTDLKVEWEVGRHMQSLGEKSMGDSEAGEVGDNWASGNVTEIAEGIKQDNMSSFAF